MCGKRQPIRDCHGNCGTREHPLHPEQLIAPYLPERGEQGAADCRRIVGPQRPPFRRGSELNAAVDVHVLAAGVGFAGKTGNDRAKLVGDRPRAAFRNCETVGDEASFANGFKHDRRASR